MLWKDTFSFCFIAILCPYSIFCIRSLRNCFPRSSQRDQFAHGGKTINSLFKRKGIFFVSKWYLNFWNFGIKWRQVSESKFEFALPKNTNNKVRQTFAQIIWYVSKRFQMFLWKQFWNRGALAARREKEGEFATTSLEFELLHWKSRVKWWLAEMTLKMSLAIGAWFLVFFQCLFTFQLVFSLRWLAEIYQLSRRDATGRWN